MCAVTSVTCMRIANYNSVLENFSRLTFALHESKLVNLVLVFSICVKNNNWVHFVSVGMCDPKCNLECGVSTRLVVGYEYLNHKWLLLRVMLLGNCVLLKLLLTYQ